MNNIAYGTLFAATLLLACQQVPENQTEADLTIIRDQLTDIEDIILNADVSITTQMQKYLDFFVDNPVILPPGDDAVQGYDAILAYYTEGFEGATILDVNYHIHEPEIFINGDIAIRRYFGSAEVKFDGEPEHYSSYNHYIDILQRQADGEWRIICHAWTPIDR